MTEKQTNDYPPLTVLPVADDPRRFYVLGESGWWYEVCLDSESRPASCECPHRRHRGAICKHLLAVGEFVAAGLLEQVAQEIDEWKQLSEEQRKNVFA